MTIRVTFTPPLLLSSCRELASHLEQMPHVIVTLMFHTPPTFDYLASPVGDFAVEYPDAPETVARIRQILDHYGRWQSVPSLGDSDRDHRTVP
ncbi:MAG: hypothetical protein HC919_12440 [Oscillatoriales cyanobacterium SM2_2_1]|nr:hypothetical protein [Oscillatoriales cyanobacterium SM2_2_1]